MWALPTRAIRSIAGAAERGASVASGAATKPGEASGGLLLPGAPRAPPEDLNPQDFRREVYRTALRSEADFFSEVIVRI